MTHHVRYIIYKNMHKEDADKIKEHAKYRLGQLVMNDIKINRRYSLRITEQDVTDPLEQLRGNTEIQISAEVF